MKGKDLVKVSIIIPMYNAEKFVAQAIQSALDQSVPPLEVIVVNDGSTDKSRETALSFGGRIRFLENEGNEGIGFTRARGVEEAQGDFIAFCSADDELEKNFVEKMLDAASLSNILSVFYSNYRVMTEGGQVLRNFNAPVFEYYEDWVLSVIAQAQSNTMSVCYNIFAPACVLKENNFDSTLRFGEDLEHLLRCVLVKKIKFVHVPAYLFRYRTHAGMETARRFPEISGNNKKIFEKINASLGKNVV